MVRYCAVSSIDHSHKAAVADLQWVPDHMEVGHSWSTGHFTRRSITIVEGITAVFKENRSNGALFIQPGLFQWFI